MSKKMRKTITETISRYGNLIPDQLKMSIAHEIAEELVNAGFVSSDDEPDYVNNNSDIKDKQFQETKLQNELNLMEKTRLNAPGLTKSDEAFIEQQKKARADQQAQQEAMAGIPNDPTTQDAVKETSRPKPQKKNTTKKPSTPKAPKRATRSTKTSSTTDNSDLRSLQAEQTEESTNKKTWLEE